MSSTPERPDWITPQAQTQTAQHVYDQLRHVVRHYVDLANELDLAPPGQKWRTEVNKDQGRIMIRTVTTAGEYTGGFAPGFKRLRDRIAARYPDGRRFHATPVVNPETLTVEVDVAGERLRVWELVRLVLEPLFFDTE